MDYLYKATVSQAELDHDKNPYKPTAAEKEIVELQVEKTELQGLIRQISDWRIQRVQQQNYSKKCYVPM